MTDDCKFNCEYSCYKDYPDLINICNYKRHQRDCKYYEIKTKNKDRIQK